MSEQGETSKQTDNTSAKVTAVEKPRKVKLGKRLAKISREAKERKARQRKEAETEAVNQREITDYIDFKYFIGGVGLVVALGGLYCSYKKDKREIREEKEIVNKLEHSEKENSEVINRRSQHSNKFVNNVKEENSRVKQAIASDTPSAMLFKKCTAQGFDTL